MGSLLWRGGLPVFLGLSLSCFSKASDSEPLTRSEWRYITIGPSFGQAFLGSEESRRGTFYSYGWVKPEPVFKYRGRQPHLHQEVFFLFTRGGGLNGLPVDNLNTVGYSFGSRLPVPWFGSSASAFVDLGWGFSFSSDTTVDLDSQINSTPYFGVGFDLGGSASHSFLVIRWFHMSNAGLRGENQGMNAVQLLFGLRL